MTTTVLARRGALSGAALISGCLVLLSACSSNGANSAASYGAPAAPGRLAAGSAEHAAAAPAGSFGEAGQPAVQTAKLAPASQSIIYTASLTVRTSNVAAVAKRVIGIVVAAGGYTSDEQATSVTPGQAGRMVSLTLKIPVASYQAVLAQLSSPALGKQVAMQQQTTDVTQQVADVNSLVTSQRDSIAALQRLFKRAASVSGLLQVQRQISSDESQLNSLLAQQRALDHETTYATVTMNLLSPQKLAVRHVKPVRHGFGAGLTAGWRAFRHATVWVLTAVGAALPFLIAIVVLAVIGIAGRRRIVRLVRRGAGPPVTGLPPASEL
jgi:Domain of unknown function (DUF4349)